MALCRKSVTKKSAEYKEIKSLIKRAFPQNEQNPMWLLNHWAKKDGVNFSSYFDNEDFCGFAFTVSRDKTVFVMYLAVSDKIRSKGYGSEILSQLKNQYPDSEITLNIEPLDKTTDNFEQRIKRLAFYERNGFYNTEKMICLGKDKYLILSTNKDFDSDTYAKIINKLSFGLYKAKLISVQNIGIR